MTIFFISTEFNYCCGVSRSIFSLARELKVRGHSIILGAPGGSMVEDLIESGINFVFMPVLPHSKSITDTQRCITTIINVVRKYNVDIIHSHNRWAEVLSISANLFLRIRTVTTSHSLIFGKRYLSFRSERVIAPSNAVEEMLLTSFNVKSNKIRRIKNIPRDLEVPSADVVASFRTQLQITEDEYIIAGIGRLHPEKGFDILLKAVKLCKGINIRIVLAGSGDEKCSLQKYAESNNLKVIFLDEVSKVELVYSLADVIVMPSRRESVSLVALEAGFFAKPVIAARVGGLAENIRHGETGLLVGPECPEEMAKAIRQLYDNKEQAQILGRQLSKHIRNEFDPANITAQMEKVYSES